LTIESSVLRLLIKKFHDPLLKISLSKHIAEKYLLKRLAQKSRLELVRMRSIYIYVFSSPLNKKKQRRGGVGLEL